MANVTQTQFMKQYHEMKRKYPNTLILFRVGDFYETFDEDAQICADICGITLCRRANGKIDNYIDLCGFPHHALDTYLPKLVRAGKRVAICEQLEDPKQKKIVKRNNSELHAEASVSNAINDVRKAVAPICKQLTFNFDI